MSLTKSKLRTLTQPLPLGVEAQVTIRQYRRVQMERKMNP